MLNYKKALPGHGGDQGKYLKIVGNLGRVGYDKIDAEGGEQPGPWTWLPVRLKT
jgi:hypothetical protein